MSTYQATISWQRNGETFTDNTYSRRHEWRFDGGVKVPASSSPQIIPEPMSDPAAVDPEEAFLASLSSCHMLWFLSLAAKKGFVADGYKDHANAFMGRNTEGKTSIAKVVLYPEVTWFGRNIPDQAENERLHHEAHKKCFIANSVKSEIEIRPVK